MNAKSEIKKGKKSKHSDEPDDAPSPAPKNLKIDVEDPKQRVLSNPELVGHILLYGDKKQISKAFSVSKLWFSTFAMKKEEKEEKSEAKTFMDQFVRDSGGKTVYLDFFKQSMNQDRYHYRYEECVNAAKVLNMLLALEEGIGAEQWGSYVKCLGVDPSNPSYEDLGPEYSIPAMPPRFDPNPFIGTLLRKIKDQKEEHRLQEFNVADHVEEDLENIIRSFQQPEEIDILLREVRKNAFLGQDETFLFYQSPGNYPFELTVFEKGNYQLLLGMQRHNYLLGTTLDEDAFCLQDYIGEKIEKEGLTAADRVALTTLAQGLPLLPELVQGMF